MGQDFEMDAIPDRLLISTSFEELRQQKVRLWVKSLILSILLGVFAICTAVLAVLYATKTYAVAPAPMNTQVTDLPTVTISESGTTVTVSESGTTVTITKTATKTHMEHTTASSETTTTAESVTTTTLILRPTETASNQSGPKDECPAGVIIFGEELLELDSDYFFDEMKFALQNNPNLVPGRGYDDNQIRDLAVNSAWRCGKKGWIAFHSYCRGTITQNGDIKACKGGDQITTIPENT